MTTVGTTDTSSLDLSKATELLKKLQDNGLTEKQHISVIGEVNAVLNKPETHDIVKKQLKITGETMVALENDFATITFRVGEIDAENVIFDKKTNEPVRFLPTWTIIHNEYTSILDASKKAATKVRGRINMFLEVILPILRDESKDIDKRMASLDSYIKILEEYETETVSLDTRFLRLHQSIDNFREGLRIKVEEQGHIIEEKIKKIDTEIANVKDRLDKSSGFFNACQEIIALAGRKIISVTGEVMEAVGTAGTIAIAAGVFLLLPFIGEVILGAALIGLGWAIYDGYKEREEERKGEISNLLKLQREKEEHHAQAEKVKKILTQLVDLDSVFASAKSNLVLLEGSWKLLLLDVRTLRDKMELHKKSEDPYIMEVSTKSIEAAYYTLQHALDEYILAVPDVSI